MPVSNRDSTNLMINYDNGYTSYIHVNFKFSLSLSTITKGSRVTMTPLNNISSTLAGDTNIHNFSLIDIYYLNLHIASGVPLSPHPLMLSPTPTPTH